jgi:hypothetical protein
MTKNKQQFYLIAHHINNEEIPTEFEGTKRVIRIRKSKKDRQHNVQKKKDK